MTVALSLSVPQASLAEPRASAMPEAPNCPMYPADDAWHALVQGLPVLPQSDTWIGNMGGASRLIHPDFGAYPYGYQLQVVDNTTPTVRVTFGYADESDDVPYPFTASTPIEPASEKPALSRNRAPIGGSDASLAAPAW